MPPSDGDSSAGAQNPGVPSDPFGREGEETFPGEEAGQEGFPEERSAGADGGSDGGDGLEGAGQAGDDPFAEGGDDVFAEGGDGEAQDGEEPAFPGEPGEGQADAGQGEEAFDRALEDFDELMSEEQETIARSGAGTAADRAFEEAAGGDGGATTDDVFGLPDESEQGAGGGIATRGTSAEPAIARGGSGDVASEPPATVEGCEDEDKVARQLCEAATEERDPFLRAALWDEYNEYRKILARQ